MRAVVAAVVHHAAEELHADDTEDEEDEETQHRHVGHRRDGVQQRAHEHLPGSGWPLVGWRAAGGCTGAELGIYFGPEGRWAGERTGGDAERVPSTWLLAGAAYLHSWYSVDRAQRAEHPHGAQRGQKAQVSAARK